MVSMWLVFSVLMIRIAYFEYQLDHVSCQAFASLVFAISALTVPYTTFDNLQSTRYERHQAEVDKPSGTENRLSLKHVAGG